MDDQSILGMEWVVGDKEYLQHHGIRGMKWGIRRYQNKDGSLTPDGKSRYSKKSERQIRKDIAKSRKMANKNRSMLSNKELDSRIKRLEKEKRLRELTEAEVIRGNSKIRGTLTKYGDRAVTAAIGTAVSYGVTKALKKKFG